MPTPRPKKKAKRNEAGASAGAKAAAAQLAVGLRALAAQVESHPELLDVAADTMAFDLWKHRMPPHDAQLDHLVSACATQHKMIQCTYLSSV